MSEFKFACPVCGQHITADSSGTGSQLECPTCYRKIVVPQAPSSTDPKFILSAAEANKPRPPQPSLPKLEPITQAPARSAASIVVTILLVLLLLAGAALVVFCGKIFGHKPAGESQMTSAASGDTNEDVPVSGGKTTPVPVVTNEVAWTLEPGGAAYPEANVAGKLRGEFVSCNRNTLTGGALGFRQATRGLPDLSVTIYFFAKQPEELRGKTINIATNDSPAPRVLLRWKEGKDTRSETFNTGYALKLELGDLAGNRISGKIYLSLPDDAQSRVAGTFTADIKKPAPPKPRPSKPK